MKNNSCSYEKMKCSYIIKKYHVLLQMSLSKLKICLVLTEQCLHDIFASYAFDSCLRHSIINYI